MKKPAKTRLFTLILVVVLSGFTQTATAQDFAVAEAYYQNNQCRLARIEAWGVWSNNPQHWNALRLYVQCAIATGKAMEATHWAKVLMTETQLLEDKALFAQCTMAAGKLNNARGIADELLAVESTWGNSRAIILQRIDGILSRSYRVDFEFLVADVQAQDHLAPYIHIPIPIGNTLTQSSFVFYTDGIASPWSGSTYTNPIQTVDGQPYYRALPEEDEVLIRVYVEMEPADVTAAANFAQWGYPASVSHLVQDTWFITSGHPDVVALAASLRKNTPFATVKSVLAWCQENIDYIAPGVTDPGETSLDIIQQGYGHCEGRCMAAAALLRANGIPARFVRGHSAFIGDTGHGYHHTILEFYLAGVGWIPWDYGQKPGVIPADFLALFCYPQPPFYPEWDDTLTELMFFQLVGVNCEYVDFSVLSRE